MPKPSDDPLDSQDGQPSTEPKPDREKVQDDEARAAMAIVPVGPLMELVEAAHVLCDTFAGDEALAAMEPEQRAMWERFRAAGWGMVKALRPINDAVAKMARGQSFNHRKRP